MDSKLLQGDNEDAEGASDAVSNCREMFTFENWLLLIKEVDTLKLKLEERDRKIEIMSARLDALAKKLE
jgi:hypothetical protein